MKYPTRLILELKKAKKSKARHFDFFKKHIGLSIFVNFKKHDLRSGIHYEIEAIKDYDHVLEFKLIRSDYNENS